MANKATLQRVQGFTKPLATGAKQAYFLAVSVPLNCFFCTPASSESLSYVRSPQPVKSSLERVLAECMCQVLNNDLQVSLCAGQMRAW